MSTDETRETAHEMGQQTTNEHIATPASSGADRERPVSMVLVSILFRLLVIAVVLGAGAGIAYTLMKTKTNPALKDGELSMLSVRTIEVEPTLVRRTWQGYGTAASMIASDIVAEVDGLVIDRPDRAEPGETVSEGAVLLRLETTNTANTLAAAEQAAAAIEAQIDGLAIESDRLSTQVGYAQEEIDAQQRDVDRIARAIDAGAGNESQRDAALIQLRRLQRETDALEQRLDLIPSRRAQLQAQLAAQNATAQTAQRDLERSTVRAPIAGLIQSIRPRQGDWVGRGSVVARVVDLSKLEIPVRLPASALSWIKAGDPVELRPDGIGSTNTHRGSISRIAPEADSISRTITVYVELEQDPRSDERIASGRFVQAIVQPMDPTPRLVVPRRTINNGLVIVAAPTQEQGVYKIARRSVQIGYSFEQSLDQIDATEDQWTVIESGLAPGDLVAATLLDQLIEGMEVRIADEQQPQPETAIQAGEDDS